MSLLLTVLLVLFKLLALLCCLWYIYCRQFDQHLHNIPGPLNLPFIGCSLALKGPKDILRELCLLSRRYGSVFQCQIGARRFIAISDHKFVDFVLNSPLILNKSVDYAFIRPWMGRGLFTADGGPKYAAHRKIIKTGFGYNELAQFLTIFETQGDVMVRKMRNDAGNPSVNIFNYCSLCTLDIICESAMGVEIKAQENHDSEYVYSVKDMCRIIVDRSMSPFKHFDFIFRLSKDYKKQQKALDVLHGCTERVIAKKMAEKLLGDRNPNRQCKNFLEILMEAETFNEQELRDEVTSFLFGGHDTVASAVSFALYCIANHPEVQDQIVEEQKEIFGEVLNPTVGREDVQRMKYLEAVIKESLRLYPPAAFFLRDADCEIRYNNVVIPKGVTVTILPFIMHRDPAHFSHPTRFDPTRFARNRSPAAFLPFSAGPRICMGQKYAMAEMKCLISKVVRNYRLAPARPRHEVRLVAEMVTKSENGVNISWKCRQKSKIKI